METIKLIPMVQFVVEYAPETSTFDTDQFDWYFQEQKKIERVRNYAKFLSQPLTLSMFVPVSEAGKVLEEPYNDGMNDQYYGAALDAYNEAKSRCLFEGFTIDFTGSHLTTITNGKFGFDFYQTKIEFEYGGDRINRIEDIAHLDLGLTLTETALNQIYG